MKSENNLEELDMDFKNWKETELGLIPLDWSVKKIGEISEVMSGGTPSTKKEEYYGGEISWITPKDLSGYMNKYIFNGERSITEEGLNNSSAKLIPRNSILFSSRAPIGYVAIAGVDLTTNQGFKNLVCNPKISDYNFMYYKMKSLKESFERVAGGSTFKEVSAKVVKEFKLILPPLEDQKAIADILSSLDEKIELNNQMNETLEEMAQALFKRWFVDFEFPNEEGQPYKSSGGEMVESELGIIPKDWSIRCISEVGRVVTGKTPSTKESTNFGDDYKFITPRDIKGHTFIQCSERGISRIGAAKLKQYRFEKYSVGVSCIGSNLGEVYLNNSEGFTNQQINTINFYNSCIYPYMYLSLKIENSFF